MSLGRRIHYRSISLATIRLLTTPGDTIQRLSLCLFTSAHPRSPYGSQAAHRSTSQVSETDTPTLAILRQVQDVEEAQIESRRNANAPRTWPITSALGERTTVDEVDIPIDWTFVTHGKPSESSTIETDRHVQGFTTLEEVLSAPTIKSLQDSFKLQPAKVRRMKTDAARKENIQKLKTPITKYTGSWSYDWRVALLELKQHYEADGSAIGSPQLMTYHSTEKVSRYSQLRAQDIPHPKVWSSSTFAAHVNDLAQSKVSRLMHRHVYSAQNTHRDAVHTTIMLLFEDESLKPYVTSEAFNTALSFYYKTSNIASARKLFNLMNETHISISAETFNIMLRGAAVRKDLHNFTYLLRVMTRREVLPNADTWIAFLMVVNDKRAKLLITRYMREAGLLESSAMLRAVVGQIIDIELASHLAGDQDLESFISLMDSRYGPNWLSVSTANQICHILGENGLVSQAVQGLGVMADRGCRPDNVTLHIFLGHCRRLRQLQRAIEFLQIFKSQYDVPPKQNEYDSLFMLAWQSKLINCCKVIWQVACLEAAVSYRMQELVLRSLLRNTPEHPRTTTERFIKAAGKVIVGIDIDLSTNSEESDPRWKALQVLSQFSSPGDDRKRSLRLAKDLLARDLGAIRHYRFVGTFTALLVEASALDRRWHKEERSQESTLWKVQHAVQVGVSFHAKPTSHHRPVRRNLFRKIH
ncbi:hypothetical protein MMC11_001906 [Xylographa trunciseda]|nr:hypothetical protein [Xylographa trunciseda]